MCIFKRKACFLNSINHSTLWFCHIFVLLANEHAHKLTALFDARVDQQHLRSLLGNHAQVQTLECCNTNSVPNSVKKWINTMHFAFKSTILNHSHIKWHGHTKGNPPSSTTSYSTPLRNPTKPVTSFLRMCTIGITDWRTRYGYSRRVIGRRIWRCRRPSKPLVGTIWNLTICSSTF